MLTIQDNLSNKDFYELVSENAFICYFYLLNPVKKKKKKVG